MDKTLSFDSTNVAMGGGVPPNLQHSMAAQMGYGDIANVGRTNKGSYPNNKLIIWDDSRKSVLGEIQYNNKIDNLKGNDNVKASDNFNSIMADKLKDAQGFT